MRQEIKGLISTLLLMVALALPNAALSTEQPDWNTFVAQLRSQALSQGIRPEVFDSAFANVHAPSPKVLHFDKTQPEKRLSFLEYRDSRVDPLRIKLGRRELREHQEALNNISSRYGVNACFIVSIWGLETSYGAFKGNFPVIQSLATLAYNPRRSEFFRKELMTALHMLNDGQVDLSYFKGEWAGASGHCQFMPTNWVKYGVAYSGQGRADIWNNVDDALASIANFLHQNGWHYNEPWALEVDLPRTFDPSLADISITKPVSEWARMGVRPVDGDLPDGSLPASLIFPDGGPPLLVFNNFKTLRQWNRSNYYAGSLGHLAEEICQQPL